MPWGHKPLCRGPDSNRHGSYPPTDFKSVVSTIPPPRQRWKIKGLWAFCLPIQSAFYAVTAPPVHHRKVVNAESLRHLDGHCYTQTVLGIPTATVLHPQN